MDANPRKFQSIVLGRKRNISFSISVQENLIVPTDNIKVFGATLDDHLKFDAHITNICIAASRRINALKRLAKFLNERNRVLIYKSFISSNFNYCPVTGMKKCYGRKDVNVLSPGRKNVMKLENYKNGRSGLSSKITIHLMGSSKTRWLLIAFCVQDWESCHGNLQMFSQHESCVLEWPIF